MVFFVEWFKDRFVELVVVLIIDFMIFVVFVVYFDIRKNLIKLILLYWGFLVNYCVGIGKFFLIFCDNKIEYVLFNFIIERVIYK